MGLFLDEKGIPLSFSLFPGNQNEQTSLKPLEKKIIDDFNLSKFVVCTDAGLSSLENRKFNSKLDKYFVTTQPVKKLRSHLKSWVLAKDGWRKVFGDKNTLYNLNDIDLEKDSDVYYKMRPILENDFEQYLFVTFSAKYLRYQRNIRSKQIDRAIKKLNDGRKPGSKKPNNPDRFIKTTNVTEDGVIAHFSLNSLDQDRIDNEKVYDGFYGICTNLEASAEELSRINRSRWEIEDSFRTMKYSFKARPVYLQRQDRINSHFLTCFLSFLIFRILKELLGEDITNDTLIETLREMTLLEIECEGYIPSYKRSDLTDRLHEVFKFRTDTEIIPQKVIRKILKETEKRK